ncbi:unnamed protein product [Malus baccata var. baccata]
MADSLEQRFNRLRDAGTKNQDSSTSVVPSRSRPIIQSVSRTLRSNKNLEKYFEPRVLAIGPIHHGKFPEWEELKYRLAADFVNDSGRSEEFLYKEVEDNIKELKQCYDEKTTERYDGDEASLAWMFFVDGCSILQFIHKYSTLEEFEIKRDQVFFAEQDLFLLENQIPYEILNLLMSSSIKNEDLWHGIQVFLDMHSTAAGASAKPFRWYKRMMRQDLKFELRLGVCMEDSWPTTHLLELLRTRMLGPAKNGRDAADNELPPSFRNAKELMAAGIHFRCSEGFLFLPAMNADAMPLFLNLIAYEMCPDFQNDYAVTSYFSFLSSLITHPEDAKQLRSARILHNKLETDEALAQLFNEIGPDLVSNPSIIHISSRLEKHYKSKWKAWMAQFFEDHFSSPWAVLAFIGALTALFLSAIQTWYSIISPNRGPSAEDGEEGDDGGGDDDEGGGGKGGEGSFHHKKEWGLTTWVVGWCALVCFIGEAFFGVQKL